MMKRVGLLAAGIAIGLVLSAYLISKEQENAAGGSEERQPQVKQDGLFDEVHGSTVNVYKVEDGHFLGYTETKEFGSKEEAIDWVTKETKAKLLITE